MVYIYDLQKRGLGWCEGPGGFIRKPKTIVLRYLYLGTFGIGVSSLFVAGKEAVSLFHCRHLFVVSVLDSI